jgi:phage tail sheath gpL-like
MPVSFNGVPSVLRVPLFYAEVDASRANIAQIRQRALLVGQMVTTGGAGVQGTATVDTPVLVRSAAEARALFGPGSHLALMADVFRRNDDISELWALPVADAGSSVAATSAMVVTGPSTSAGTISLYIAGRRVQVGVSSGQAATAIATAIAAAVNADTGLPVTAAATTSTVTLTARNRGTLGNQIDLRLNYGGAAAGEALPAGVGVTTPAFAGGATDPVFTTAFAALADEEYDFIALPYTDTTSLDAIRALLDDTTGRWSWSRQVYGHAFSARSGTVGNLVSFGNGRNDQHVTVIGFNNSPSHALDWTAALTAQACRSLSIDPARPLQTLPLLGVLAPPIQSRFTIADRQTLYADGVASYTVRQDGTVQIDRAVTTYQVNAFGQPDVSYLDVETLFTLAFVLRRLRIAITSKYGRHKLANDGTRFGAGQAIVTPNILKSEILAEYRTLEELGIVENFDAFKSNLVVERNVTDPNRVDVLLPPDLVNGLRVFAVLAQFRLNY